jgi:hypothetical protein
MSVTISVTNTYNTADMMPVSEITRRVMKFIDNPKLTAVWAMVSTMEAHIDMTADNTCFTPIDVEQNLAVESVRDVAKEMLREVLADFQAAAIEAIDDLQFCKTELKQVTLDRNADGTYALNDADVQMSFDFQNKRV